VSADIRVYSIERRGRSLYLGEHSLFAFNFSLFYLVGNSAPNSLWMLASSAHHGPDFDDIPCIFPEIREFGP
jgi:hypothetical protein